MPVAKRRIESPADRAITDRVRRARLAQPPRGTEWYVAAGELAAEIGADVNDVLDDFDYHASVREYDGGVTRAEAERLGFEDVRERYTRQARLL